jgi:hypothetical protein
VNVLGSALAGEVGFGIFVAAALVLIVMVTRFSRSLAKKGRDKHD